MKISNQKLKFLVENLNLVPPERLEEVYQFAEKNKKALAEVLVESDLISDDHLGQVIADELGYDFIDLDKVAIEDDVLQLIPRVMAEKQKVISFDRNQKGIKLAMVNPGNLTVINLIEKKTGQPVILYYTTAANITNALAHYQKGIEKVCSEFIQENISQAKKGAKAEDLPIIKVV